MSKTFTLDLKSSPIIVVKFNGIEVHIQPLSKREDKKLVDKHTKGKVSILQTKAKKGFRKKESEKDEVLLPDTDYLELNIERAVKTWKKWNIEFDKKSVPCDEKNIEAFFNRYYDSYALPIIEKFDELIKIEEPEEDKGKS